MCHEGLGCDTGPLMSHLRRGGGEEGFRPNPGLLRSSTFELRKVHG